MLIFTIFRRNPTTIGYYSIRNFFFNDIDYLGIVKITLAWELGGLSPESLLVSCVNSQFLICKMMSVY